MTLERPIFMIGMGRSGTTVIFEALAHHEHLGWLSNYIVAFPRLPRAAFAHNLFFGHYGRKRQHVPVSLLNKFMPKPLEGYPVWNHLFGVRFARSFVRSQTLTETEIERARQYLSVLLKVQRRKRFAAKLTGPPRINFLYQAFPDACFVHIVRDPRAVVASLLNVDFWQRRGLSAPFWDEALSDAEIRRWRAEGSQPSLLAALQWRAVMHAAAHESSQTGVPFLQVSYEAFVDNPRTVMTKIVSFTGLPPSEKLTGFLERQKYRNMNDSALRRLEHDDIRLVEHACRDEMSNLGYPRWITD